jgi:hypothetical protein
MSIFDQPFDPKEMDPFDAVRRGHWIVNRFTHWVPLLLFGIVGLPFIFADKATWWAIAICWALLWYGCWVYAVSRWRRWAVSKGCDAELVEEVAQESGLVPYQGSWLRAFDLSRRR